MLSKLIKHEFRATRRNFLILFAAMLFITLFMKPLFWIRRGVIPGETFTATELMGIWVFIVVMGLFTTAALVLSAVRFYQSMTCDEAYLTFTLPVTPTQIIWSKLLVGLVWNLAAFFLSILCFILALAGTPIMQQQFWQDFWSAFRTGVSTGDVLIFALGILTSLFANMIVLICVIGIGQLFGKYRLLGTIGSYFAMNVVRGILALFIVIPMGLFSVVYMEAETEAMMIQSTGGMGAGGLIVFILYHFLFGIAAFLISGYIFNKKLNVE